MYIYMYVSCDFAYPYRLIKNGCMVCIQDHKCIYKNILLSIWSICKLAHIYVCMYVGIYIGIYIYVYIWTNMSYRNPAVQIIMIQAVERTSDISHIF